MAFCTCWARTTWSVWPTRHRQVTKRRAASRLPIRDGQAGHIRSSAEGGSTYAIKECWRATTSRRNKSNERCMKILSAADMREVDRLTTERFGVPSLLLMENAATRTVEATEKKFGDVSGKRALVICGRGNNGGDGAAIARLLHNKGAAVDVLVLGKVEDAKGDARTNFEAALE